jgi:hypothetical protein
LQGLDQLELGRLGPQHHHAAPAPGAGTLLTFAIGGLAATVRLGRAGEHSSVPPQKLHTDKSIGVP